MYPLKFEPEEDNVEIPRGAVYHSVTHIGTIHGSVTIGPQINHYYQPTTSNIVSLSLEFANCN